MMLSDRLYDLAQEVSEDFVLTTSRTHFLWIWQWLYINQSDEQVQADLAAIEQIIDSRSLKPEQWLSLAWKAEALEQLLSS